MILIFSWYAETEKITSCLPKIGSQVSLLVQWLKLNLVARFSEDFLSVLFESLNPITNGIFSFRELRGGGGGLFGPDAE